MSSNNALHYEDLDADKKQFRLLRILPNAGQVSCELRIASIDDSEEKWKALSYRWGTEQATHEIHINDRPFLVRPNLYTYFKQRAESISKTEYDDPSSRWLFVDAICINQSNAQEKGTQVRLMSKIYGRASEVIVYLTVEEVYHEPMASELNAFHEADEQMGVNRNIFTLFTAEGIFEPQYGSFKDRWGPRRKRKVPEDRNPMRLLRDEYWSRLWIVQEVLMAKEARIHFGQYSFPWRVLMRYHEWYKSKDEYRAETSFKAALHKKIWDTQPARREELIFAMAYQILKMKAEIWVLHEKKGLHFRTVINHWCSQRCSVLEDKIFGLFGMAEDCYIHPDYNMPRMEFFVQVLANYLLSTGLQKRDIPDEDRQYTTIQTGEILRSSLVFTTLGLDPRNPTVYLLADTAFGFFTRIHRTEGYHGWFDNGRRPLSYEDVFARWALDLELASKAASKSGPILEQGYSDVSKPAHKIMDKHRASLTKAYQKHFGDLAAKLTQMKMDNVQLTAPCGTSNSVRDWMKIAEVQCETIWQRHWHWERDGKPPGFHPRAPGPYRFDEPAPRYVFEHGEWTLKDGSSVGRSD